MKFNLRTAAIAATAALSLAATSATPVHALGKNEKNFLLGAGAALLLGSIYLKNREAQAQQAYRTPTYQAPTYQQPTYYQPTQPTTSYSSSAARAFNSYSATERRQIQSKLRAYGYYRGAVDGSFGPQTQQAVSGYAGATLGTAKLSSMNGAFEVYDSLLY
ncbi:peptidoglycan-binding domain-containing protein [Albidovulum sediminis]|uniref:Peptidoglycan-binding protein n=1 Tax=Albidovulum sediminis TaxID=3066345 RepID=A0ABT2NMW1_9RHOB|nr:peptidoglycan-binding domain-containing protein [Defluviimonas sediminis]MCT8330262.1 peptidoglycan-binding protein [Defluviimonas sediminis]